MGSTGFCGGQCCSGDCFYDQNEGNYTCCASSLLTCVNH